MLNVVKLYVKPDKHNNVCAWYPSMPPSICQVVVDSDESLTSSPTAWLSGTPEVLQDARSMAQVGWRASRSFIVVNQQGLLFLLVGFFFMEKGLS